MQIRPNVILVKENLNSQVLNTQYCEMNDICSKSAIHVYKMQLYNKKLEVCLQVISWLKKE